MACGCNSACGCVVIGDGTTTSVIRLGDTFTVSSLGLIDFVADTPCIDLNIDEEKVLTAALVIDPTPGSVELECGLDGLVGRVVVDPASTAIVSEGVDGLRVDVPPPAVGSVGPQPGDLILYEGVGPRSGAIDADGDPVSRVGYAALFDALSLYATAATRVAGDATITGIPSTRFMAVGMPLEATGFPFGMTVASILSSTSIVASAPANSSGNDTEVRVYPHGNGDGIATFNTPNGSRRYAKGYDYLVGDLELGDIGGGDISVGLGNLPLHDHPATTVVTLNNGPHGHPSSSATDGGHTHSIGSDGIHNHQPGTASDSQFVTVLDTLANPFTAADYKSIAEDPLGNITIPTQPSSSPSFDYAQGNRAFTSNDGAHNHGAVTGNGVAAITVNVASAATNVTVTSATTDVGDAGSLVPAPIPVDPAYIIGRWMVVI